MPLATRVKASMASVGRSVGTLGRPSGAAKANAIPSACVPAPGATVVAGGVRAPRRKSERPVRRVRDPRPVVHPVPRGPDTRPARVQDGEGEGRRGGHERAAGRDVRLPDDERRDGSGDDVVAIG